MRILLTHKVTLSFKNLCIDASTDYFTALCSSVLAMFTLLLKERVTLFIRRIPILLTLSKPSD